MSEIGDMFGAVRERTRLHHAAMLDKADVAGWTRHTAYHFSRKFGKTRVDWWPSSGKAMVDNKMVYGHKKVNALIERLKSHEQNQGS